MVFTPHQGAGELPAIPDNIPISEFMLNDQYGRNPLQKSRDPFTCGITGKSYSGAQVAERVDYLARALAKEFNWTPNQGTEWDKTLAVFSVNTIDTLPLSWATHQLGGIVSPANAAYSAPELKHQLVDSQAKALFTCAPLLSTALEAASLAGFPKDRIYLLEVPTQLTGGASIPAQYKTVSQLIEAGRSLPKLERLNWGPGDGARRTAFLCYSSGTSGLPKGVMISHKNVISNVLQISAFEKTHRDALAAPGGPQHTEVVLGLLPQSHIYALVVICHTGPYRGDQVIVLPKFELNLYLAAIQNYKIGSLFLVPPIIITMLRNHEVCKKYDLSSVKSLFTGAAPLGMETAEDFQKIYPGVTVRQGYGLTETCTVVASTHPNDIFLGSSGNLIPGVEARIVSPEGQEITSYDTPGELVIRSPSVVLGYLNNEKANQETFENGWMRTGDEAVFRLSPKGTEHVFIVDRIKELIKVKGLQVAPAELEAHLLTHPAVADCAVIAIPDEAAGEVPKAIVVKSASADKDDEKTIQAIKKYVEEHKARHKWLKGGIRFVEAVPKSPSGKILRRLLRDQEKEERRRADPHHEAEDAYVEADEAEEIFQRDEDHPMDSDGEDGDEPMTYEQEEITLENDSSAHFDLHSDSLFCIAQHPIHNSIVLTGSGDDTAYIFDSTPNTERPLLPQSYESNPQPKKERESLQPIAKIEGHKDTINAVAFTGPKGEYAVTAGLDGQLRVWRDTTPQLTGQAWEFVAEAQEVEEINWLAVCPCEKGDEENSNVIAIGANDGSAWVFRIDHNDIAQPITIIQTFFQHTGSCTAGAWTPDGKLLATVSEDGSFYVYDVFGAAAAAGISYSAGTNAVVGLTPEDQRFAVDGGLYSVAVAPGGGFAAVGGAEGHIRIVGLPRLASGGAAASKAKGKGAASQSTGAAAGTILASLQAQSDGIETLSFSSPPLSLLAAGSVDGSIALFDTAHRFAVRRHIKEAHEGAVVKVEFLQSRSAPASLPPRGPIASATSGQGQPWLLTSVGMDGIVRRWDARGGTAAAAQGLLKEWKGHLGLTENSEGEQSGGVMAFTQSLDGKRVVTAGDDGISFVFEE
ncbi:hypothetical protein BDV33DRAFT_192525 [Aspergillus novoparasiticus]|uniref:WD40-repeat-containing domain protein n=1 Tax=Aspergillus novoparasiticus TaxID=986946 RepID=A0A5N6EM74_9EURO|nr:hypothetical protein BDV33DRAFT_192525 [Aspergillus novoparasiticus]